ncbi:hypothetical protein QBC32DRAFT_112710 [Pseudoneurospora amorphoporcata]|uniref:Uncharacterized protein n=1 Tax=Pseudoneurospora amorphoporcata TaxID=241081 RepID=A0AAN6NZ57_9PEZI|nr:hypothetical protein QBC32DRAFT_112710 [Pseudoneurospora amorphoporcata]
MSANQPPNMEPGVQSVFSDFKGRSDCPVPGFTYIILHQPTNRALSIIKGYPALHRVPEPIPGVSNPTLLEGKTNWHWECVESDGWLSFRNAATGKFLGHDADENEEESITRVNFRCSSTQPGLSERFAFGRLLSNMMPPNMMPPNMMPPNMMPPNMMPPNMMPPNMMPPNMIPFETVVDGPVEVEHGEGNKRGAVEGDAEKIQAPTLFSLLPHSRRWTPCNIHQVSRCGACGTGFWKLVAVQVKPESLAEGLQLQMVWDADDDVVTIWRFVKVVPLVKVPVEDEVTRLRRSLGLEG